MGKAHKFSSRHARVLRRQSSALSTLLIALIRSPLTSVYAECDATPANLAGYQADMIMRSRQARGDVRVLDGCSFRVELLEVGSGCIAFTELLRREGE